MLICAAGDIHGAVDRMYEDVSAFEAALGVPIAGNLVAIRFDRRGLCRKNPRRQEAWR